MTNVIIISTTLIQIWKHFAFFEFVMIPPPRIMPDLYLLYGQSSCSPLR